MRIYVLGTGSSGNGLVVEAEGERLLVDAGIGPARAAERMRALGGELARGRAPLGLFVTHEHGDHAAHAMSLGRALRVPVYAHAGVRFSCSARNVELRGYEPGRAVALGPFVVETLAVPHDAPQVALRVTAGPRRVALVTDLGMAPRALHPFLSACDLALVESNHCPRMLATGPYPLRLQRRVAGPEGHLSNEQTAALVASLEGTRLGRVLLVHLSRTNNAPARALEVVRARARRIRVDALAQGEARLLDVLEGGGIAHAEQLGLRF